MQIILMLNLKHNENNLKNSGRFNSVEFCIMCVYVFVSVCGVCVFVSESGRLQSVESHLSTLLPK